MKCDELKAETVVPQGTSITLQMYGKGDVDAAITELKAENDRLKAENDRLDDLAHAHNLELLQKENIIAELKVIMLQKEDAINEAVDKAFNIKKERDSTKRALWLARAERAVAEQTIDECSRYKEKHPCGSWRADPFEYWVQAWIYVEKLCRKKAEEYK